MAERSQAQRDADAIGNGTDRNPSDSPPSIDLPRQNERNRLPPARSPFGLSKLPGQD